MLVFFLLTAPSLLCGSSLFTAQAHKSHLFQKLKGENNSQLTVGFIIACTLQLWEECFTDGWIQGGGMNAWLSLVIYSYMKFLLLGTKTQSSSSWVPGNCHYNSGGSIKGYIRPYLVQNTQSWLQLRPPPALSILAYCIFPHAWAVECNKQTAQGELWGNLHGQIKGFMQFVQSQVIALHAVGTQAMVISLPSGNIVPNPHSWKLSWQSLSWVNKDLWTSLNLLETVPGTGNFLVW